MCLSPLLRYPAPVPELLPFVWLKQRVHNNGVILKRHEVDSLPEKYKEIVQRVPCGRCVECRLARSREWALRILLEEKYCPGASWFVTLTYDDDHLPELSPRVCSDTGVVIWQHALVPDHLTLFLKRLRSRLVDRGLQRYYFLDLGEEKYQIGLRYFACGEFGEKSLRPHYHLCLLNCDLPDVVSFGRSKTGELQWFSQLVQDCWKAPDGTFYGRTALGKVTAQSAAYVARYIMKKQLGKSRREDRQAEREAFGTAFVDEFVRCSRRPGLGRAFFEEHKQDIYRTDEIYCRLSESISAMKPPRYYDSLFDLDQPDLMAGIKEDRIETAKAIQAFRACQTDLTDEEYLANKALRYKDYYQREPQGTPIRFLHT